MSPHEQTERRQDRSAEARLPLTRQARRRLEVVVANQAIQERYNMPRRDRRAFARLLRKVA